MGRSWPGPPGERTVHFIGDLHIGVNTQVRLDKFKADLAHRLVPIPAWRVQVGDFIENAAASHWDGDAVTYMDTLIPVVSWDTCIGNHDLYVGANDTRTVAAAQAAQGYSTLNYERDLGFCRLLIVNPQDFHFPSEYVLTLSQTTIDWLDARLTAAHPQRCLIINHAPLANTVLDNGTQNSTADFFQIHPSATIRTMLAEHANVAGWISGHTHNPMESTDMVKAETLGGNVVAMINASSIYNCSPAPGHWYDRMATPWVTVYDDYLEVRWRDHGASAWVGPFGERVITVERSPQ